MRLRLGTLINKLIIAFLVNVFVHTQVFAEKNIGVIVPELRAPYKIIFDAVGEGIDDALNERTPKIALARDYDPHSIQRWINKEKIEAVIALGGIGQKAAVYLPQGTPVVLGVLLSSPGPTNSYPGIALTPNPKSLFMLLERLDSKRKKIIVVYSPAKNQWLVDLAKRQTAANGVQLVAYKATDIKQAAIIYSEIFNGNRLDDTAIWLLQDGRVNDSKVVLPFILEQAWQKKIVVFSSALGHVKKGVLFSLYPDNKEHGKQLAELMKNEIKNASSLRNMLQPSEGLQDAINSRTAEHLGIDLSRSELRKFDVVFPLSN